MWKWGVGFLEKAVSGAVYTVRHPIMSIQRLPYYVSSPWAVEEKKVEPDSATRQVLFSIKERSVSAHAVLEKVLMQVLDKHAFKSIKGYYYHKLSDENNHNYRPDFNEDPLFYYSNCLLFFEQLQQLIPVLDKLFNK